MERRKFLSLGALAAVAAVPSTLSAIDYRKEKPDTWKAHKVEPAIEKLYGKVKLIEEGVKVKTPDVAANGGAIPIDITSKIAAKSVALLQDANPESTVAVWTVPENGIVDYSLKIKMQGSGTVTAIVEGLDGKYYVARKTLQVALGGCEG